MNGGAGGGASPAGPVWQPFTFGGLPVVARGGNGSLFLAQLAAALGTAAAVVYFLQSAWSPVIFQAARAMPDTAAIRDGALSGVDETIVAGSRFFAVAVTPEWPPVTGQTADFQVQFRRNECVINSIFRPDWGIKYTYEPGETVDLAPAAVLPWLAAWRPVALALAAAGVFAGLFTSWTLLAALYWLPIKIIAWVGDKALTWGGAWRLAMGAMLPGAVLLTFVILLYTWSAVDLVSLIYYWFAHLVLGWIYCVGGVIALPKNPQLSNLRNPFDSR